MLMSIFLFIIGLVIGSLLNCIIYRLYTGESFLFSRSHCPHCGHILAWQDLIPVLSFIILKGRCRYCRKKISWQYPLVEITTAILFVASYKLQTTGCSLQAILNLAYLLTIFSFLIIIFVYDLKHYIILDKVIYSAIGLVFLYRLFGIWYSGIGELRNALIAALSAAAFFFIIWLVSRGRWMGFGDVKLAFLMGLFLGWPNILIALFSSFLFGAIIAVALIAFWKKTLKSKVPFGPFLVGGTLLTIFAGEPLINWYLHLLL